MKNLGDQYALEAENILANGPFKLVNWSQEQSWKLVKNEDYWDAGTVKIEEVNVFVVKDPSAGANFYETEKIDRVKLTSALIDQYVDDKTLKLKKTQGLSSYALIITIQCLGNPEIRRAIGYGS